MRRDCSTGGNATRIDPTFLLGACFVKSLNKATSQKLRPQKGSVLPARSLLGKAECLTTPAWGGSCSSQGHIPHFPSPLSHGSLRRRPPFMWHPAEGGVEGIRLQRWPAFTSCCPPMHPWMTPPLLLAAQQAFGGKPWMGQRGCQQMIQQHHLAG